MGDMDDISKDTAHGIKEMAKCIGKTERQTHYLAASGQLPGAFRLGKSWALIKSVYAAEIHARAQQGAIRVTATGG